MIVKAHIEDQELDKSTRKSGNLYIVECELCKVDIILMNISLLTFCFIAIYRCYNCGEFANHLASQCNKGPLPKRCHNCKSEDHLIEDCPTLPVDKRRTKNSAADNSSAEIADDEGDGGTVDSQKYQEKIVKTRRQTPSSNKRTNNGGRKKGKENNGN